MHQAKAARLIASHLRQHSQDKRVKIFHLLIASNFKQQISSKETWQMPDLKTSISLSETEFKKGTYLPGLTSKYAQDERVKTRDVMVFSGQDKTPDPWHLLSDRPSYANH